MMSRSLVIHLLEMVVNHIQSAHGQNMAIMDVVANPWMKIETSLTTLMPLDERSVVIVNQL